ncbi:MAG: DUF2061 domain-containing protein, partial [Candidatus Hodarchaeales archaeon]
MVNKIKSIRKTVTWRIIGVLYLFAISYIFTRSLPISTYITLVHHATFLVVFYFHERVWNKIKEFKLKPVVKAFSYEIVIAIPIMVVIAFIFTGQIATALKISFLYTFSKVILYAIYDKFFYRPIIYMDMVGDLFHIGHSRAIKEASKRGKVIIGLVSDGFAEKYKRKPVIPYNERKEILSSIKGVHKVVRQWNLTSSPVAYMKHY